MPAIPTDDPVAWSVCMSVTLVHHAEADGLNEMPFDRDTRVVPISIVLDRGPVATGRGDLGNRFQLRSEPPVKIYIAHCGQTVTDSGIITIDSL